MAFYRIFLDIYFALQKQRSKCKCEAPCQFISEYNAKQFGLTLNVFYFLFILCEVEVAQICALLDKDILYPSLSFLIYIPYCHLKNIAT